MWKPYKGEILCRSQSVALPSSVHFGGVKYRNSSVRKIPIGINIEKKKELSLEQQQ